jgi:hypothetical protein
MAATPVPTKPSFKKSLRENPEPALLFVDIRLLLSISYQLGKQNTVKPGLAQNKKPVLFYLDDRIAPAWDEFPCPLTKVGSEKRVIYLKEEG